MYKRTMNTVRGIGIGIAAAAAVAAVSTRMMNGGSQRKARHLKKAAGRAVHNVSSFIGDVEKMIR